MAHRCGIGTGWGSQLARRADDAELARAGAAAVRRVVQLFATHCAVVRGPDAADGGWLFLPTEGGLPKVVDARDGTIRPLAMPDNVVAGLPVAQHGTGRIWVGTDPDGDGLGLAYSDDGGATWNEVALPEQAARHQRGVGDEPRPMETISWRSQRTVTASQWPRSWGGETTPSTSRMTLDRAGRPQPSEPERQRCAPVRPRRRTAGGDGVSGCLPERTARVDRLGLGRTRERRPPFPRPRVARRRSASASTAPASPWSVPTSIHATAPTLAPGIPRTRPESLSSTRSTSART